MKSQLLVVIFENLQWRDIIGQKGAVLLKGKKEIQSYIPIYLISMPRKDTRASKQAIFKHLQCNK